MRIEKERWFEAAHKLEGTGGPCDRLHGHSYRVVVRLEASDLTEGAMVIDFSEISAIIDEFDHEYLNDLPHFEGFPTTAENIAIVIAARIKMLMAPRECSGEVEVWETRSNCAVARL